MMYRVVILYALMALLTGCANLTLRIAQINNYTIIKSPTLQATLQIPTGWTIEKQRSTLLYSYGLWTNKTRTTGIGIVHISAQLDTRLIVKLFMMRYKGVGQVIKIWTDQDNRSWVKGEDQNYTVEACVITKNGQTWIIYCGCIAGHVSQLNQYKPLLLLVRIY